MRIKILKKLKTTQKERELKMIKQLLKELLKEELNITTNEPETISPTSPMIGKVCMIRTYSAGVHFGTVVSKKEQNVVLHNAKRVHYWTHACSLSQLAMDGDGDMERARISVEVPEIELDQVIEVIPMSEKAIKILRSKTWRK